MLAIFNCIMTKKRYPLQEEKKGKNNFENRKYDFYRNKSTKNKNDVIR